MNPLDSHSASLTTAGELSPAEVNGQEIHEPDHQRAAIARLFWERRRFVFRVALWGLVISVAMAFVLPVRYEATTRLMPPENQSEAGMALLSMLRGRTGSELSGLAGSLLGVKGSAGLFVGILESRTVQDDLIRKFDLRKVYWVSLWTDARKKLASRTKVTEERKSGIITITVTDKDPERAAALAREYVQELNFVLNRLNTSSAHRERVFLEKRLGEVQKDLETAETDFSQFASKNTAIDIKEQGRAMVEAAANLQGQLIAAKSQLEGLKQIYSDNNVRVRSVRARIDELQHQLEKMGGTPDAKGSSDALYPSIRRLPILGVTYADLYRRTKVQEVVFETLTQQYELAKVQEAKETPSISVLDSATAPEKRSFPPRLLIVVSATLLALCGSLVWVLTDVAWRQTSADDPRKVLAHEIYQTVTAHVRSTNGKYLRWRKLSEVGKRDVDQRA